MTSQFDPSHSKRSFPQISSNETSSSKTPPVVTERYLIVGQPQAGKSSLAIELARKTKKKIVLVNSTNASIRDADKINFNSMSKLKNVVLIVEDLVCITKEEFKSLMKILLVGSSHKLINPVFILCHNMIGAWECKTLIRCVDGFFFMSKSSSCLESLDYVLTRYKIKKEVKENYIRAWLHHPKPFEFFFFNLKTFKFDLGNKEQFCNQNYHQQRITDYSSSDESDEESIAKNTKEQALYASQHKNFKELLDKAHSYFCISLFNDDENECLDIQKSQTLQNLKSLYTLCLERIPLKELDEDSLIVTTTLEQRPKNFNLVDLVWNFIKNLWLSDDELHFFEKMHRTKPFPQLLIRGNESFYHHCL